MSFQWENLTNPVYGWRYTVRDPAAIWHDGRFYIYFTVMFNASFWGAPECFQVFVVTTEDFRDFDTPRPITPKGYVSPGNVIRFNGRWYISVTRYPWPGAVAVAESDDLLHWSEPRVVVPSCHGSYWSCSGELYGEIPPHGPIDGYILEWQGKIYMLYTDAQRNTTVQHLGLAVSEDMKTFTDLTPDQPLLDSDFYNGNRGIENASMVVNGDTLHLFCSVGMSEQRVAMLTSRDILSWGRLDSSCELDSLRQNWSQYAASAQFVADWRELTGYWTMLFMGMGSGDAKERALLGMARSLDLKHWEVLPEPMSRPQLVEFNRVFRQRIMSGEFYQGHSSKGNQQQ